MNRLFYEEAILETVDFILVSFKNSLDAKHLPNIGALFNN